MSFFKDIKNDTAPELTKEDADTLADLAEIFDAELQRDQAAVTQKVEEEPPAPVKVSPAATAEPSKALGRRELQMDEEEPDEVTVITQGTTITGSIKSDTSLVVKGVVESDVECSGKLTIIGRVAGNIIAKEIYVSAPRMVGDINSEGIVKVDVGTVVIGDVCCTSLIMAGAIKGNIDVDGPVVIESTAIVKGNIKAKTIQIEGGAVLEGNYSLPYVDFDWDSCFEE